MDKEYILMRGKYHFEDTEHNRKRWKLFAAHRKACRAKAAERHKLYVNNRTQWEKDIAELPAQERNRQVALEKRKASLLSKLKR